MTFPQSARPRRYNMSKHKLGTLEPNMTGELVLWDDVKYLFLNPKRERKDKMLAHGPTCTCRPCQIDTIIHTIQEARK